MRKAGRLAAAALLLAAPLAAQVQPPEAFFGFRIGADGELARYPKVVDYLRHLAASSQRVRAEGVVARSAMR